MPPVSSISTRLSDFTNDSFVSENDADKNRLPEMIKITAEETIQSLKMAHYCAIQVKHLRQDAILNTTDRLKKLELKHTLVCNKHVLDFSEQLIKRLEKSPEYCHKLYDKYQKFLDTHTSLQCVHFYDILRNPTISHDFVMEFIPFHKRKMRDLHCEGLNILSLGNNSRVFAEFK
ncbi:MAG: hypothetical protein ACRCZ6_17725 [Kluyvera sp.]|uniref:hypothetical protein n=1 Tax=Kluyvera sp. TaxID=1538228 RepID=UPI003F3329F7